MSNSYQNPGEWKLSDVKALIEGETEDNPIVEVLSKIFTMTTEEANPNFILGKVVIENDLLDDDEDEDAPDDE